MDQDERIKAEYDRLMEIFKELNENERTVADGLIREAAYMNYAMDQLKKQIKADGLVEQYRNGEHQTGYKESSALRAYNNLAKTYKTIIDRLLKITPVTKIDEPTFKERWHLKRELKQIDEVREEYKGTPEYIQDVDVVIKEARAFMEKLYPY